MRPLVPRLLLATAGLICGLGSVAHAAAYVHSAAKTLDQANFRPFFAAELRVLWLSDSTTLAGLAVIFAYLALRPAAASAGLMMLIATLPAATAALLYLFVGGSFYAAHLLLAAAVSSFAAGALTLAGRRGALEKTTSLSSI
jgi:hypothetical protein